MADVNLCKWYAIIFLFVCLIRLPLTGKHAYLVILNLILCIVFEVN